MPVYAFTICLRRRFPHEICVYKMFFDAGIVVIKDDNTEIPVMS